MSYWIDYEMLKAEINLHRDNAQRIIKSYKEQGKSFPDSNSTRKDIVDRLEYQEAIGMEVALAVVLKVKEAEEQGVKILSFQWTI